MSSRTMVLTIISLIAMMGMIGAVSAQTDHPQITIFPDSGPNVASDGTLLVPVGQDAFTSIGLMVEYKFFKDGNPFSIFVVDSNGKAVFNEAGSIKNQGQKDDEAVHWTPMDTDVGKSFTIIAEGFTMDGKRTTFIRETAPINAIPVSPAVLGGFVVAAGLVMRRIKLF